MCNYLWLTLSSLLFSQTFCGSAVIIQRDNNFHRWTLMIVGSGLKLFNVLLSWCNALFITDLGFYGPRRCLLIAFALHIILLKILTGFWMAPREHKVFIFVRLKASQKSSQGAERRPGNRVPHQESRQAQPSDLGQRWRRGARCERASFSQSTRRQRCLQQNGKGKKDFSNEKLIWILFMVNTTKLTTNIPKNEWKGARKRNDCVYDLLLLHIS